MLALTMDRSRDSLMGHYPQKEECALFPPLKFLACAQAGSADYLVTGDQELLKLRAFQGGGPARSWTPKAQPLCHGPQALYIVTLEIG